MRYLYWLILILFFSISINGIAFWQCAPDDYGCQKAQGYPGWGTPAADTPQDGGEIQEVVVTWKKRCRGIQLNTNIPFIGNCIVTYNSKADANWDRVVTPVNAFPTLIGALMNLLMTVILIMSLLMIVWSWVLMTMSWVDASKYTKWVNLLKRVAIWMALLGASWVILKVINPNFFI